MMLQRKASLLSLSLSLVLAAAPQPTALLLAEPAQAQGTTPSAFPLPSSVPSGTTVRVDGSESMAVINQTLKQRFETQYPGTTVELAAQGTDAALKSVLDGSLDLAAVGRPLTEAEIQQGLVEAPISREKIAIIVGPNNPFQGDLTFDQFARIFRGEITDWSEVGGSPGPIRLIDRPELSDTRQALSNYSVFQSAPFQTGANATQLAADDTAALISQLGTDGISYTIANQVSGQNSVRIIPMHGTLPTDPRYPYSQPRGYVYKDTNPAVLAFLGYATSAAGQQAIAEARSGEAAAVAAAPVPSPVPSPAASPSPLSPAPEAAPEPSPAAPIAPAPAAVAPQRSGLGWLPWLLLPLGLLGLLLWALKGRRTPPAETPVAAPPPPPESAPVPRAAQAPAPVTPPVPPAPVTPPVPPVSPAPSPNPLPGVVGAVGAAAAVGLGAMALGRDRRSRIVLTPRTGLSQTPDQASGQISAQPDLSEAGYAYWEADEAEKATLRNQGGKQLSLKIADVTGLDPSRLDTATPHSVQFYVCGETDQDRIVPLPQIDRDYIAEIGYLTPEQSWLPLARSAPVRLTAPSAAPLTSPVTPSAPVVPSPPAAAASGGVQLPQAVPPAPVVPEPAAPVPPISPVSSASVVPEPIAPEPVVPEPVAPVQAAPEPVVPEPAAPVPPISPVSSEPVVPEPVAPVQAAPPVEPPVVPPVAAAAVGAVVGAAALGSLGQRQSRIALASHAPGQIYAQWEAPEAERQLLRQQGGRQFGLRLYDVTGFGPNLAGVAIQDYDCAETEPGRTLTVPEPERDYAAEFGYWTAERQWLTLGRSNTVRVAAPTVTTPTAQTEVEATRFDLGHPEATDGDGASAAALMSADLPTVTASGVAGLAALASVDDSLPELPDGYGESRLTLLPRDPQWVYAYWDAPDAHKHLLRQQGGQRFALRFYDITDLALPYQNPHSLQQYECDELARDWYIPVPISDRDYIAELGYVTSDGRWLLLARSNPVRVPPVHPTDWYDEQFLTVDWDSDLRGQSLTELMRPGQQRADAISDRLLELAEAAEAERVAGSLFGSMQQVPPAGVSSFALASGIGLSGIGLSGAGLSASGIGLSGVGLSGIGMSGIGFYSSSGIGITSSMSGVGMSGVGMSGIGFYSSSGVGLSGLSMSGIGLISGAGMMSGIGLYTESGIGFYTTSGIGLMSGAGLYTTSGIGMSGAGLLGSYSMSGIGMSGIGMSGIGMSGIGMSGYTISGMGMSGAGLYTMSGMGISGIGMSGIGMSGIGMSGIGMSGYTTSGMGMSGAGLYTMSGMGMSGIGMSGIGMSGYTTSGMGMSGAGLYTMSGMGMSGIGMSGYTTSGMGMSGIGMSGIGMSGYTTSGMGMSGAGLYTMSGMGMSGMGMSGYTTSGIGMSGIGMSGIGMSGIGMYSMSGVGSSASVPLERSQQFWLTANAELIVHGSTVPNSTVTIAGRPVSVGSDGTFRIQLSFQDGLIDLPILAVAPDGAQSRSAHMTFTRETPSRG